MTSRPSLLSVPRRDEWMLRAALDAVTAATVVCRRVQQRAQVGAFIKDDCSPVTIADLASQAVIAHSLQTALGPVSLVAEEDARIIKEHGHGLMDAVLSVVRQVWPDATSQSVLNAIAAGSAPPGPDGFWTLDPVDGTKGFLRRQQYAISLAYIEGKQPIIGVLACPNLSLVPHESAETPDRCGVLCFGLDGQGAFELPADDPTAAARRLRPEVELVENTMRICVSAENSHSNGGTIDAVVAHAGPTCRVIRVDSQCKYALVARGEADAYIRIPASSEYVEWIWDHAAGALMASEAGCRVTDLLGRPLRFDCGRRLVENWGVLCAPPRLHERLLGAVRAALELREEL